MTEFVRDHSAPVGEYDFSQDEPCYATWEHLYPSLTIESSAYTTFTSAQGYSTATNIPSASVEYPCADANFVNADVSIVNDISIIDNYFLEALEEFNEDCFNFTECEQILAPEAVALPVVESQSTVFAFAVPEVYLPYSEQLLKSDKWSDDIMKNCMFEGMDSDLKYGISCVLEDMTSEKLMTYLSNPAPEKTSFRKSAFSRWREKREKKKQQLRDGTNKAPSVSARQVAASKRVRENGKFKKLSIKWIPASDFRATSASV